MGLDNVQLHIVDSAEKASDFIHWLQERRPTLGVDTETGGFTFFRDGLRLIQFGDPYTGWALPYQDWRGLCREAFQIVHEAKDVPLIFHNAPFDIKFILHNGLTPKDSHGNHLWPWERTMDTMTLAGMVFPSGSRALKNLSAQLIDARAASAQKHLASTMADNKWTWATVPEYHDPYWAYGALDPVLTTRLWDVLSAKPHSSEVLNMELATLRIVTNMMLKGMKVDLTYCHKTKQDLGQFIVSAREFLKNEYGLQNATSDAQIVSRLTELGIDFPLKFTASGKRSVDKEVLSAINHPIAQYVLGIKQSQKMITTYFNHFIDGVDDDDRVHPTIWATGARTGRNTITDPALQTLKKKGGTVRNAFIPKDDHSFISIDADQIEARLAAHFSQDQGLIAAFQSDDDFFTALAKGIYHDPDIAKSDPRRSRTKTVVYAKLYGGGVEVMAKGAGTTIEDMQETVRAFDTAYPGIRRLQHSVQSAANQRLQHEGEAYVTTPLGRRLIADDNREYALTNYLIQGHAAEVFKQTILKVDAAGLGDYLLLPIHDEILFEVPTAEAPGILEQALEVMNTPLPKPDYAIPITWSGEVIDGAWGSKYEG